MGSPYKIEGPAIISFSMGRTSGYMLHKIIEAHGGALPEDVKVVTANTGLEALESLDFWEEIRSRWGVPMTMIEFDPDAPYKTRIVNHNSASRNGEPMKAAIDTRPTQHLFNAVSRYCTGVTKKRRIETYGRDVLGWPVWAGVLGIRADEPRRIATLRARYANGAVDRQTLSLPLADAGATKEDVIAFWRAQPFDLRLPYDAIAGETIGGNCNGCVVMAEWKVLAALRRRPEIADWWIAREDEMEARVASIPRTSAGPDLRHRFFNTGKSFRELKAVALSDTPIIRNSRHGGGSVDCNCTD